MDTENADNADSDRPLLVYDADCGFCVYWAHYWEKLTGDRVAYEPYQKAAVRYPDIPPEHFQRAVQYIAPDGKVASAAEASFLTLSHTYRKGFWLALYRKLPGFAPISECVYAFIASHRPAFHRLSLLLWGRDYAPPDFALISWLFMRLLGLVFLAAFISFGVQAMALIGSHGVLPLSEFTEIVRNQFGTERYWLIPMVFWLNTGDFVIQAVCWGGAVFSLLLVIGILPRLNLLFLYILYLSLFYAGQRFMSFQWDLLLLETGFLALLLSIATKPGICLLRWLMFRFMFVSGMVKIMSGEPTWLDLSALNYHFQTQPLPTPLAWYAHNLPSGVLSFATGATLFIELVMPFFVFLPRRLRFAAAFSFLLLQTLILLTGNYNFFNILSIVLCLVLFDDAAIRKVVPQVVLNLVQPRIRTVQPRKIVSFVVGFIALWTVTASAVQYHTRFGGHLPALAVRVNDIIAPLRIVNTYGPFSVMTTRRPEIIIEGSNNGVNWREYTFKYKPGNLGKPASWNIPHQPRIDWQLWFAAMDTPRRNPWFVRFMVRILEERPAVISVFEHNPFPDKPPRYVRAQLYNYRFASRAEKGNEDMYWKRDLIGLYFSPIYLKQPLR